MTPPRLGHKTGPKPKFSANDVIDVVLEIGLDKFTMAQVARRLGVVAASLYRVYASRDELIGACLEEIARRDPWQSTDESWQDMLKTWGRYCWDLCEKYSGFALTLYTYPFPQVHMMEAAPRIVEDFCRAGLDRNTAIFVMDFIGDTTVTIHLGLAAYRIDSVSASRRKLILRNMKLTSQQLGLDMSDMVLDETAYDVFVAPKINFIVQALDQGVPIPKILPGTH